MYSFIIRHEDLSNQVAQENIFRQYQLQLRSEFYVKSFQQQTNMHIQLDICICVICLYSFFFFSGRQEYYKNK